MKKVKPVPCWRMYPDDGGLKEPVRSYDSTFSAVEVLLEMFFTKKEKKE